jgi:hypothetical protein
MRQLETDSQGVKLEIGQRVAYNQSGSVVPGVIERIVPGVEVIPYPGSTWTRLRGGSIHVRKDGTSLLAPVISHVTDGNNLMVIG